MIHPVVEGWPHVATICSELKSRPRAGLCLNRGFVELVPAWKGVWADRIRGLYANGSCEDGGKIRIVV